MYSLFNQSVTVSPSTLTGADYRVDWEGDRYGEDGVVMVVRGNGKNTTGEVTSEEHYKLKKLDLGCGQFRVVLKEDLFNADGRLHTPIVKSVQWLNEDGSVYRELKKDTEYVYRTSDADSSSDKGIHEIKVYAGSLCEFTGCVSGYYVIHDPGDGPFDWSTVPGHTPAPSQADGEQGDFGSGESASPVPSDQPLSTGESEEPSASSETGQNGQSPAPAGSASPSEGSGTWKTDQPLSPAGSTPPQGDSSSSVGEAGNTFTAGSGTGLPQGGTAGQSSQAQPSAGGKSSDAGEPEDTDSEGEEDETPAGGTAAGKSNTAKKKYYISGHGKSAAKILRVQMKKGQIVITGKYQVYDSLSDMEQGKNARWRTKRLVLKAAKKAKLSAGSSKIKRWSYEKGREMLKKDKMTVFKYAAIRITVNKQGEFTELKGMD